MLEDLLQEDDSVLDVWHLLGLSYYRCDHHFSGIWYLSLKSVLDVWNLPGLSYGMCVRLLIPVWYQSPRFF